MQSLFGSKPKKPAEDPEVKRLREQAQARAAEDNKRLKVREAEEKLAVKNRLRGSRALFTAGTRGFDEDQVSNLGGVA